MSFIGLPISVCNYFHTEYVEGINFKEALLQSGRGARARNSLVYNYKFGFDSKICVIGFTGDV